MSTQFGFQISTMKFGKNTNESMPHALWRAGLRPGGSSSRPMSGASHGPNRPLRSFRSIGLTMLRSFGGDWPPHDDTMPCGPSSPYASASYPYSCSLRDSSDTDCFACRTGAW